MPIKPSILETMAVITLILLTIAVIVVLGELSNVTTEILQEALK